MLLVDMMLTFTALIIACSVEVQALLHNTPGPAGSNSSSRSGNAYDQHCGSTPGNATAICPLGFHCTKAEGKCECLHAPDQIVSCGTDPYLSFAVLDCICVTYDASSHRTLAGYCVLNCENYKSEDDRNTSKIKGNDLNDIVYHKLPNRSKSLDNCMCRDYNRTGVLCGRCLPEHYPLAYSFSLTCIRCPHARWNWVKYIAAAYLPLTLFCMLILFLKVNVVSSHLHPAVFYSQFISISALARVLFLSTKYRPVIFKGAKVVLTAYGIWNLDFFRPFYTDLCLGIGILPTLALDYAIAVYPLLLMVVTYLLIVLYDRNYRLITLMWRPFQILFSMFRKKWDIRTSIIDSYSTFFLLSNIKILSVSFDLLAFIRMYSLYPTHYNSTFGLYYAADIEYFGQEHLPYAILAIFFLVTFILAPITILALYPFAFFQKFLNRVPLRWYILHTFVDTFQGCYKDGTQPGTRDCRWFSALYLVFRLIFFCLYGVSPNAVYFPLSSLVVMLFIILVIMIQPYKAQRSSLATTNSFFFVLFAMFTVCLTGCDTAGTRAHGFLKMLYVFTATIGLVPLVFMLGLLGYWVWSRWRSARNRRH